MEFIIKFIFVKDTINHHFYKMPDSQHFRGWREVARGQQKAFIRRGRRTKVALRTVTPQDPSPETPRRVTSWRRRETKDIPLAASVTKDLES